MHRHTVALSLLALCLTACGALTACAAPGAPSAATRTARLTPAARLAPAGPAAATRGARPAPTASPPGCRPARRAWAAAVSDSGKVTWQVRLPTDPTQSGIALRPLVVGGEALFAEFNGVYALRLGDGHLLWRRTFPAPKSDPFGAGLVYGLWRGRGTVVVLVGQVSASSRLVSLNLATGAVRWTLPLSRQGVTGNLTLTADGGLAMIRGYGTLSVADLTTGRLRWSRTAGHSPGPVAVGTVVAAAANGRAVGYDDRTGAVLWTRSGLPGEPVLAAAGGLVLVQSDVSGGSAPTVVTALAPRTGRVAWRFAPGVSVGIMGAGPAGIVMTSYTPDRLYLVNPATGRPRWSVNSVATYTFPNLELVVTKTRVVLVEGRSGLRLVDRRAADGKVLWSTPLSGYTSLHLALTSGVAGPNVVATTGPPGAGTASRLRVFRLGSGRLAGTATLPTLVQAPLAVAGSSTLVQLDDPVCAVAF
jgi:outer membrane protein assembly factor BamB